MIEIKKRKFNDFFCRENLDPIQKNIRDGAGQRNEKRYFKLRKNIFRDLASPSV